MRTRRKPQQPPTRPKILDLLPHQVRSTFECMDIAEECIKAACVRWPEAADRLQSAFLLLVPTQHVRGYCDGIYKAHADELLERVALRQDTRPATKAEALCGLMQATLKAPPGADYSALVNRLFDEVLPGRMEKGHMAEQWPGQHEEMLSVVRGYLSNPSRRVA